MVGGGVKMGHNIILTKKGKYCDFESVSSEKKYYLCTRS